MRVINDSNFPSGYYHAFYHAMGIQGGYRAPMLEPSDEAKRTIEQALMLANATCPGVSTKRRPGTLSLLMAGKTLAALSSLDIGISVAPMRCVMPPASEAATVVPLIASKNDVFPWST